MARDARPPLVEFFGIPGAGKSTIARRATRALRERGLSVEEPTYVLAHERSARGRYASKFRYALRAGVSDPRLAAAGTRAVLASDQRSARAAIKSGFNWWFVAGTTTGDPDALRLLDQGFVQAAWSIDLGARTPIDRERLLERALARPARTLVVAVEVSPDTARERLRERADDGSRVERDEGYSVSRAAETTAAYWETLDSIAASAPTVETLAVENENRSDLDTGVDRVTEAVLDLPSVDTGI